MATLDSLKRALRQKATRTIPCFTQPLSDVQYSAGFDIMVQGSGWATYQDFIIPQLSQVLSPLISSRIHISVLEIGPGPKSILGRLPKHLARKIGRYAAYEPNGLFAARLEDWLCSTTSADMEENESRPLPCLQSPPDIRQAPFASTTDAAGSDDIADAKYDVVLFCHSMYGMTHKHSFIRRALEMVDDKQQGGTVVVFHRDSGALQNDLATLLYHRTASFPAGIVHVPDTSEALDTFAAFIAGFTLPDAPANNAIRAAWRKVCRALGRREEGIQDTAQHHLAFSAPETMATFTPQASGALSELTAQVPLAKGVAHDKVVKNWEARRYRPAAMVRPTDVQHVQLCVRWALRCGVGLTVVGGGHGGHCVRPGVVAVDMGAFDRVHVVPVEGEDNVGGGVEGRERGGEGGEGGGDGGSASLVVAEAGCKTGDIVRVAMAAGVTVPLGARPSVGAGLWLQGGIGHLARQHGLASDAIVGAVVVSVGSGEVLCVGRVPAQHQPDGAVRPENESELLWAIRGAGTNVGVVVSVTFRACAAPTYVVRNWAIPLNDGREARRRLRYFDRVVAGMLPRNCAADAYLYCEAGRLHLGVTTFESCMAGTLPDATPIDTIWGPEREVKVVDDVGLFEMDMYMSGLHGGHGGGKTSSFKRCLFLKCIGEADVTDRLITAIETCPLPRCYLHLLQGGGAVGDVAAEATAFGCRDWDFACVITGVWPRDQDSNTSEAARSAVQWVYNVVENLLPLSSGAYGADLGPDTRDAALAARAFGLNRKHLARLKRCFDPHNVLAYACPLPQALVCQKLIILVTGESGAGKDYSAAIWVSFFNRHCSHRGLAVRAASISHATKQEYAAATGADFSRLLSDRAYKEQHRPALSAFYRDQIRQRPQLPEEHFLNVVQAAADADVLLVTGVRDEAPVAAFAHLVPDSRILEVRVRANEQTRRMRREYHDNDASASMQAASTACPSLTFTNDTPGAAAATAFAQRHLLPLVDADLPRLAAMVRRVPDHFPGVTFRHVLGVAQQAGGLALCTALLQRTCCAADWANFDAVACCEAGGFVFAAALALRAGVPLLLVREAGKLPSPTLAVGKPLSYISSRVGVAAEGEEEARRVEMERDALPAGVQTRVVVVDDVLSTGRTLCAVLELLGKAGVAAENVGVVVVAEFPVHRGRELLRRRGFGGTSVQSLLVFDGV